MHRPRRRGLAESLHRDWKRRMQQRENEVRTQRNVEIALGEIIVRPKSEKNESRDANDCDQGCEIFFCDAVSKQRYIDQKKITEEEDRPASDRGEGEKVKCP